MKKRRGRALRHRYGHMGTVLPKDATYVTSYCNHPHRLRDGKPVGHECHILPPNALLAERSGDVAEAQRQIQSAKKYDFRQGGLALPVHRGVK